MKIDISCLTTATLLVAFAIGATNAFATDYYVDATHGNDAASGLAPDAAWKTLKRVSNAQEIVGGDVVRFKADEVWREGLAPRSGEEGKPVTYTSYGEGKKPSFWRSVSLADERDWVKEGDELWATRPREIRTIGQKTPLEPGRFSLHTESGAKVKKAFQDGVFQLTLENSGTASNHIQWIYSSFPIRNDRAIRLSFEARASKSSTFSISLMSPNAPWNSYGAVSGVGELTSEYRQVEVYLTPNRDADAARLTFYMGGAPEGIVFELKDLVFEEVAIDELELTPDVGNIILDGREAAFKRWTEEELKSQDDFYYNRADGRVWYRSKENPAKTRASLEAAVMRHVINLSGVHDAVFDGLDIRYGSAHGFGGSANARCVIRNCDVSWIGGGDQYCEGASGRRTRYGNGIEFWASGRDHLVENCRLWEIYDAAITNQGAGTNEERNIVYRNNLIWNCEYSFEYWNRDETSITDNIAFVDNVCLNAGYGWGHAQRRDPNGRCLMFYSNTAQTTNFVVQGNVFANATESLVRSDVEWKPEGPRLDKNLYWQDDESIPYALWLKKNYLKSEFEQFKRESGQETGSQIKKVDVERLIPKDVR